MCADRVQERGVLVLEVAPTCCYAAEDFDVVVCDSWPAGTDYCFEDLQRLEELWRVITPHRVSEDGGYDRDNVLM